jgi:2-polyprenyl-6-methoxyphenol hydroxylase-like FAD-dependent oxidoreductase
MRQADVVIIGGGLAGSTAAAMLGRAGIDTVLVDPHEVYPPELRAEKIDGSQVEILRKTGLADAVLQHTGHATTLWIARNGRLVDKQPHGDQHGILYDHMVNALRAEIPDSVTRVVAKVVSISPSAAHQTLRLSTGEEFCARLIVLANGLNLTLRHMLGLERVVTDVCHSITIAFDMLPAGRAAFDFPALTYYPEHPSDRFAYLTLFPMQTVMRANFMVYRDLDDPWLTRLREAPEETLRAGMPGLAAITGPFAVGGPLKIRPADLYFTRGHLQPGVVLVGDAFATSCPAAGTGTGKVFTDVERLCNVHIPAWLATPGMGTEKIATFYTDPIKQAYDRFSIDKARSLRSTSIDPGLRWKARRFIRFAGRYALGAMRHAHAAAPSLPAATDHGNIGGLPKTS